MHDARYEDLIPDAELPLSRAKRQTWAVLHTSPKPLEICSKAASREAQYIELIGHHTLHVVDASVEWVVASTASGESIRQQLPASMPSDTKVYIAGVGYSPDDASAQKSVASLVSAATKALLDAGITYEDVTHGITCRTLSSGPKAFKAFGEGEANVDVAETGSELDASIRSVRDRGAQCVLMIAAEKVCSMCPSPCLRQPLSIGS